MIHYHAIFGKAFKDAVRKDYLETNPMLKVDRPKKNSIHEAGSGEAGLWQCVSMMPYAPKTEWTGDVPAKKNGQTNQIHLSILFGGASGSRTLAPVSRPIAFRVFEIVG